MQHRDGHTLFGGGAIGFALEALGFEFALVATRDFLHHADAAHGHEIARQAEAVGTIGGHEFDRVERR